MGCYTPLQGYKDIATGGLVFVKKGNAQKMEVACGQCFGCRSDHALMWTIRITHEAYLYDNQHGNSWVTLTYQDPDACTPEQFGAAQYLPDPPSLRPSDVSKFIRALRKQENKIHKKLKIPPRKIRYFYCGEYGELGRPHYHVCMFNHTFDDTQLFKDDEGLYTYTSPSLQNLWPHGFSTVQPLSYRNAAYTAGYVFKKITGKRAEEHYLRCDEYGVAYWLKPEFIRMSTGNKNPPCGLGAGFYEKYSNDIFPSDETPVPGKGVVQYVPRYYQNILQSEAPDVLETVKESRQAFYKAHPEDFTPERLRDKYKCAKARQHLKRTIQ